MPARSIDTVFERLPVGGVRESVGIGEVSVGRLVHVKSGMVKVVEVKIFPDGVGFK